MGALTDDVRIRAAQLIYTCCMKEIIRQVTTDCCERGHLMDKIWNSNITLFRVAEEVYQEECKFIKQEFTESMADSHNEFEDRKCELVDQIEALEKRTRELEKEVTRRDRTIVYLKDEVLAYKENTQ